MIQNQYDYKYQTEVFRDGNNAVKAVDRSWPVSSLARVVHNNISGLVLNKFTGEKRITEGDLPVEFFNHQVMECNADDDEEIIAFMEKWGLLFSPTRANSACINLNTVSRSASDDIRIGILETEELKVRHAYNFYSTHEGLSSQADMMEEIIKRGGLYIDSPNIDYMDRQNMKTLTTISIGQVVSLSEARGTLKAIQETINQMFEYIRSREKSVRPNMSFIRAGAANKKLLDDGYSLIDNLECHGFLVCAICNQAIETIESPDLWRSCRNAPMPDRPMVKGCSRIYKHKQGDTPSGIAQSRYDSGFCCEKCRKAYAARKNYDKKKAARKESNNG